MQEATLRRVYHWDFHEMDAACRAARFAMLEGHPFDNDKRQPTSMCLAPT